MEKQEIEQENQKLKESCVVANDKLKNWNELVKNKYDNIIKEINDKKEEKKNMEKKYKGMIKQIKSKEIFASFPITFSSITHSVTTSILNILA